MKRITILAAAAIAFPAFADGPHFHADLVSYNEVPSVVSTGRGTFSARTAGDWNSVDWELTFDGLQAPVTQAHIHLAQRGVNGPIIVWLCGTAALPGPPGTAPCPQSGPVHGTFTAANVAASPASQQLAQGQIGDFIQALDAGFGYANVHTTVSGGGEIRGQINPPKN